MMAMRGSGIARGIVRGIIDLFRNPKVSLLLITIIAFIMLLLYILKIVPWGTGRECWAQC
jgi:hypothetical protein